MKGLREKGTQANQEGDIRRCHAAWKDAFPGSMKGKAGYSEELGSSSYVGSSCTREWGV